MIRDLTIDYVNIVQDMGDDLFSEDLDYSAKQAKYFAAVDQWKKDKPQGKNLRTYLTENDAEDPKFTVGAQRAKNLHILRSEIKAQVDSESAFRLLGLGEFNANTSLLQLLENLENTTQIRKLYRRRKLTSGQDLKSGIGEDQARTIRNCMRQGRDLFIAGQNGTLMIKPLVWFYSLTAYAYACIILNSPIRYTLDTLPGSHGLNYLPEEIRTQFGGSVKQGTFSELFLACPTAKLQNSRINFVQNLEPSIRAFQNTKITSSCGTLLSLLPEMREYYSFLTGRPSRTHPLEIVQIAEGRGVRWEFQIGDGQGQNRPDIAILDKSFINAVRSERQGRVIVSVNGADLPSIKALIYTDSRGRFWYIDNPFFPVMPQEICVHFLLVNAFSSIMRYKPGIWGDILLNEVESDLSLLTRQYFTIFDTKLPLLLLRHLSEYNPFLDPEA